MYWIYDLDFMPNREKILRIRLTVNRNIFIKFNLINLILNKIMFKHLVYN